MTKDDAFNTIVAEFAKDMEVEQTQDSWFSATANDMTYAVNVRFKGRDYRTNNPRMVRVVVWYINDSVHNGQWVAINHAARAAKIALATLRNIGYAVQGELL